VFVGSAAHEFAAETAVDIGTVNTQLNIPFD